MASDTDFAQLITQSPKLTWSDWIAKMGRSDPVPSVATHLSVVQALGDDSGQKRGRSMVRGATAGNSPRVVKQHHGSIKGGMLLSMDQGTFKSTKIMCSPLFRSLLFFEPDVLTNIFASSSLVVWTLFGLYVFSSGPSG